MCRNCKVIKRHGVQHFTRVCGHPAWPFFVILDIEPYTSLQLRTLYLQEMFARGILVNAGHNLSYAHSVADIETLLNAYDAVLPILGAAVAERDLPARLHCEPLRPLFSVR